MITHGMSIVQRDCNARAGAVQLVEGVRAAVPTRLMRATMLQRAQQPAEAHPAPQPAQRIINAHIVSCCKTRDPAICERVGLFASAVLTGTLPAIVRVCQSNQQGRTMDDAPTAGSLASRADLHTVPTTPCTEYFTWPSLTLLDTQVRRHSLVELGTALCRGASKFH